MVDRVGQREVLVVVVGQHEVGHLVGHRGEQLVALLAGEVTLGDDPVEQDLDVHLVVGGVHAGGVVDEVGVQPATLGGVLDPAALGEPEVAALADALDPQLGAVDADGVVGLVPGLGVGLGARLDVGADAAVPQQVHRRQQDRAHQLGRGHPPRLRVELLEAERLAHLRGDRDRLRAARPDPAALGDQRRVVVLPRGPRQVEEPLALGVRRGRVGVRVDEDVPVVERRDQPGVLRAEHAVAEHVAGHVADADAGEVLVLAVDAHLAEVAAHRDPGAAGGDAHGLVVVAHRPARGEGVTEPEAVVLGDLVGDVAERRRALVGGHDQVGVVAVVAHHAASAARPCVPLPRRRGCR